MIANEVHPHIVEEVEKWPINRLSKHRKSFVDEMNAYTFEKISKNSPEDINSILESTIYKEKIRIKASPWKVDPANEKLYWQKLEKTLKDNAQLEDKDERNLELLKKILNRYSEEIVGNFNPKTFLFARKFLTALFRRIFLKARGWNIFSLFGMKERLMKKLIVSGHVEEVRSLFDKGTVVFLPTHFSNLDSILIGYVIDTKIGLPSFSYGAGLNLFNAEIVAYFINRLGAYKVDRRKKNAIYLESLKVFSTLSVQRGINSLFFPGGTRSRSGMIEKNIKLGLLNSLVEAQRNMTIQETDKKIFVVPIVTSYHSVLEGSSLIDQHLKSSGKEKYLKTKKKFGTFKKLRFFLREVYRRETEFYLNVGKPMDVFGNELDKAGNSVNSSEKIVDLEDYFSNEGELTFNPQREKIYTRNLGDKIVERFHTENVVLTSHIVAFSFFSIFKKINEKLDLYTMLSLPLDAFFVEITDLERAVSDCVKIVKKLASNDKLLLSESLSEMTTQEIIVDAIGHLSAFHIKKPILKTKYGTYISQDYRLLYFYSNRLLGYKIEGNLQLSVENSIAMID